MYWLMLLEQFGPIVINISRVIHDILTLIFTYAILVVAFSFGLVFILDDDFSNIRNSTAILENRTDLFNENRTHLFNETILIKNDTIDEYLHKFGNVMYGLTFIILDPGTDKAPDVPDDTARNKFATLIYCIYFVFAITILLNLTITLMNATVQKFQDSRQLYWKFVKTSICIEFFDQKMSLPVPFSFLRVIWFVLILPVIKFVEFCCQKSEKRDDPDTKHLTLAQLNARRKHAKLMQELISRFINKTKKTKKRAMKSKSVKQYESRC